MGSDKQLSYTVLGPTVNLAMRLCQAARPTQILATETTITAAGKDVVARALGPVKAKGFTDPIQVFDVGNVT
jgi:class 3 adenylate cyclase